jgi:hypothetical protein
MDYLIFPKNINGIDYNLIDQYSKTHINYNNIINTNNEIINISNINTNNYIATNDNESTTNNNIVRLEPPYIISCTFIDIDKCQKKAAFKQVTNNKFYCWFHMHCNN